MSTCLTRWCAAARPAQPAPATATFLCWDSPPGETSARTELPRRRRSRRGRAGGGSRPPATRAAHPHILSAGSFRSRDEGTDEWPGCPLEVFVCMPHARAECPSRTRTPVPHFTSSGHQSPQLWLGLATQASSGQTLAMLLARHWLVGMISVI